MSAAGVRLGVRVELGAVQLRLGDAGDAAALGRLVGAGLFADGAVTVGAWYDPLDLAASAARAVAFHLHGPANSRPNRWVLPFAVCVEGRVVGAQHLAGDDTAVVSTGSWLEPGSRGAGVGTVARLAVLAVAFDHLGARLARSAALVDNDASARVSLKAGYRPAGFRITTQRGEVAVVQHFELTVEEWRERPRLAVRCSDVEGWRARLGR